MGDLSLLSYSDNAIKTVEFTDDGVVANPAVQVQLQSDHMGQTLERWLAIAPASYSHVNIGPAHLEIAQAQNKAELQALLSPPTAESSTLGNLRLGDRSVDVEQALQMPIALEDDITVENCPSLA
ncbi:MAG: hypothetical protein AAGH78_18010 [Cyanobacteria bacterium P01_H01_bin.58]